MKFSFLRFAALAAFASTSSLWAQTVESIPYRAMLRTNNENPPVALDASGAGTVWLHVVRDANGEVISGSVDFSVSYKFPAAASITAMHIHDGVAGVNGQVVIDSGITRMDDVTTGVIPTLQAQVSSTTPLALTAFKGILEDPSRFYLNVHTAANPSGVFRGQLERAQMAVRVAMLSPANENPPIAGLNAAGRGTIVMLRTTDNSGNTTSASITFDVAYTGFPAETAISAMHLHLGPAGVNGPVTIDSTLSTAIDVAANGNGFLRFDSEVDLARAGALQTIDGVFNLPAAVYLNVHTRANPGGAIRGQLLSTDEVSFQVNMSPANENPPIAIDGNGWGKVSLYTARGADGNPMAGAIIFDINARFGNAPTTTFTNLHVHDGDPGVNGPVTLDSRFTASPLLVKEGVGNIWRVNSLLPAAIPSLISAVTNPEKHYANLHSQANPSGVIRAQLAAANTGVPVISTIITGASEPTITNVSPGGTASIYGVNFAKSTTNISGINSTTVPTSLNGTSVTVGGVAAPILLVTPDQINIQVPFAVEPGELPVVVKNPNGESAPYTQTVAAAAPAIMFDSVGGIAVRASDQSLVRPDNAATAGDIIAILVTGLGGTVPAAPTGVILPQDPLYVVAAQPTVTIAGRIAPVLAAVAAPGFIGLYGVVVTVPPGIPAGDQLLVVRAGGVPSNSVNLSIK
jgi:uncharacterized protein (TIGR03437 family)